uniref:Uncharacterized protein n=1 Tax=Pseudomonas graminis TaxID=158627 RepID=A0A7C2AW96_9PSED
MKKSWYVTVPGYPSFPMIMPEDHGHAGALAFARCKWPALHSGVRHDRRQPTESGNDQPGSCLSWRNGAPH